MSRYDPATPRLAFGVAAIAATAATLGLLVFLPSRMEPDSHVYLALAATTTTQQPRCEGRVILNCADAPDCHVLILPAVAIEAPPYELN